MSDLVLARKHRPAAFAEVIGQDATIRQLQGALEKGTLGHALLFCGTRGTGKTTTARIVAKELNPGLSEERLALVVSEIDAASNTGVDDVRQIIENIRYSVQGHRVVVLDECFPWSTPITLADGRKLPIGKIVLNKMPVEVLSYNKHSGCIEPKRVTNWIKKKAAPRDMVRVSFSHKNSFTCTPEHKVYTSRGMVRASELKVGDTVLTKSPLDSVQERFLIGSILGDGHLALSRSGENARFAVKHSTKQEEYLTFKYQILKRIVGSTPRVIKNGGYGDYLSTFTTRSDLFFRKIYSRFYNKKKEKVITKETFVDFDAISLAFLYMDDGSIGKNSVSIATDNFSEEDNRKIAHFLKEEFGLNFKVYSNRAKGTHFLAASSADNLNKFFSLIAPYTHPSMYYKLPTKHQGKFIGLDFFTSNPTSVYESQITKVTTTKYGKVAVYDLTVEDNHNYFVNSGFLVSNCHMLSKNAWNAALKTLEEPPAATTFILITTEPNKVPATVRSRCQTYEFRDVDLGTLKQYYASVAADEGLTLDDAQLQDLALRAEGSVRDGLSLLQKYLGGEEVVNNASQYFDLVGAIYGGDTIKALEIVNQLRKIEEPRVIIQTLEKWFHWASLEFFGQATPVRSFIDSDSAKFFDLKKLQALFSICLGIERDLTSTPNSKIVLEMGVLRLSQENASA